MDQGIARQIGSSLSIEQRLLLCCARNPIDAASANEINELLANKVNWPVLGREATRHGLIPLLSHAQSLFEGACPAEILHEWRTETAKIELLNKFLVNELEGLLALFKEESIPVAVLKGPVSAVAHYGGLGLRKFSDIDLLVPESHLSQADSILARKSYAPQFVLSGEWKKLFIKNNMELAYSREKPECLVDLHWRLVKRGYSFGIDCPAIWDRLAEVKLGDLRLPSLPPEETLIFLCLHGAKHGWASLNYVCDVAQFLKSTPKLNCERLRSVATNRTQRFVTLGALLARTLLNAPIPAELLAGVESGALENLQRRIVQAMFDNAASASNPSWVPVYYECMQGADRLRYLFELTMTPTPLEWEWIRLPAMLSPAYYFLRPVRLGLKYTFGAPSQV